METLDDFLMSRPATSSRPLLGLTVLLVEDSRFAADAVRLMCLRSGARLRRADSLAAAERHLRTYRPHVLIVDLGLPDGSGLGLIARLSQAQPRVGVILGLSGDPDMAGPALAAGADGFMDKPIPTLGRFQTAILEHLPPERHPAGPRLVSDERISADPIALRDDLAQVAPVLAAGPGAAEAAYVAQFLGGLASTAGDQSLTEAVAAFTAARGDGPPSAAALAALSGAINARIAGSPAI
jgi:CheY-like chemotaxis protein